MDLAVNTYTMTRTPKPKPFVKWPGGKRQLITKLSPCVPAEYNIYHEPFIGGGALLFHLQPKKAAISDINPELINCYTTIRDNLGGLIQSLSKHVNDKEYYYEVRALDVSTLSPEDRASRFIFLNKTCFNGLYRENSKGQFNAAFGYYENPLICDEANLTAVHKYLTSNDVTITCQSFDEALSKVSSGDFVYLDPPYVPMTATANFESYTKHKFGPARQEQLAHLYREMDANGVKAMESNSNTDYVRELYAGFDIETLSANRSISRKASSRKKAPNEVLIKNFKTLQLSSLLDC